MHRTKKLDPDDEGDVVAGTRGLTADPSHLLRRDMSCWRITAAHNPSRPSSGPLCINADKVTCQEVLLLLQT